MVSIDKDSSILPLFWDLAAPELEKRLESTEALLTTLAEFQTQFQEKIGEKKWAKLLETLFKEGGESSSFENVLHGDVSYSITRLIKGLSSPRESARQGFSLAFTELLRLTNFLPVKGVVELLKKHSQSGGSMKSEQARNMLFGRLFGLLSIARSGILSQEHVTIEDWKFLFTSAFELRKSKTYLQESCSHLITSLIAQTKGTNFEKELALYVWDASISTTIEFPDELAPLLSLVSTFSDLEFKLREFELFKPSNSADLALILRRQRPNQAPGLPSVWTYLLDSYNSPDSKSRILGNSLNEFWTIMIDNNLFSKNSGADRQYLGLLVVQYALVSLSPYQLPLVLTDNLCHCLAGILNEDESPLTKINLTTLDQITEAIAKNPHAGLIFVGRLYNIRSRKSKTLPESTQKLISSILTALDEEGLLKFVDYLQDLFGGSVTLQGLSLLEAQKFAISQISKLVKIVKSKGSEASFKRIVKFFTFHSLFKSTKFPELRFSECVINQEVQQLCADHLVNILSGALKMAPFGSDRKASKAYGQLLNGDTWIKFTIDFIKEAETSAQFVKDLNQVDAELKNYALKILTEVEPHHSSKNEALSQASKGITLLVQHLILAIYLGGEGFGVALQDIQTCFDHMTNPAALDDQPEPIDVLIDLLISFLSKPSNLIREMTSTVFGHLTGMLKKSTLELLLEVFTSAGDEKNDLMEEEDDEFEEIDSDDLAEESEDEGENSNEEEDENEDEDENSDEEDEDEEDDESDEDMDDGPVDPILLEKLKSALGPAVAGENEDDNLGDDQMMAFDEKLSEIFKERKAMTHRKKESKLSMAYLKLKIMEWIGLFVQLQSNNPLVVSLGVPLITFAKEYHLSTTEKALFSKIMTIITKDIPRYNSNKPEVEGLLDLLGSAHEVSRKTHSQAIQRACLSVCKMTVLNLTKFPSKKTTQAIVTTYKATLVDYIDRRKSAVSKEILIEFTTYSLPLSWRLTENLVTAINLLESTSRSDRAIEILLKLFEQSIKQKFKPEDIIKIFKSLQEKVVELLSKLLEASSPLKNIKTETLRDFFKLLNLTYRFESACNTKKFDILAPPILDQAKKLLEIPQIYSSQSLRSAISLAIASSQADTPVATGVKREAAKSSKKSKKSKTEA